MSIREQEDQSGTAKLWEYYLDGLEKPRSPVIDIPSHGLVVEKDSVLGPEARSYHSMLWGLNNLLQHVSTPYSSSEQIDHQMHEVLAGYLELLGKIHYAYFTDIYYNSEISDPDYCSAIRGQYHPESKDYRLVNATSRALRPNNPIREHKPHILEEHNRHTQLLFRLSTTI